MYVYCYHPLSPQSSTTLKNKGEITTRGRREGGVITINQMHKSAYADMVMETTCTYLGNKEDSLNAHFPNR